MTTDLKDLIDEFNCWQQGSNQSQVPTYLKQKIIELCERYSLEQVVSCLGLKRWHGNRTRIR